VPMDKDTFFTTKPSIRIKEVNQLLQKYDLKQVAEIVGIPYSTFTKEMRVGDYFYHQSDKQYYPFVRSEEERKKVNEKGELSEITFIQKNLNTLKNIVQLYEKNKLLLLDERIYGNDAGFVNKSIKMNTDIYEEFSKFCDDQYPHLKMQDLIAQALINFMNSYKH